MATNQKDITSLLYTEAQARLQYANTPGVKKPLEYFWYDILPDYKTPKYNPLTHETVSQLHEIEESLEYMMEDIINGIPFEKEYSWEYSTPTLRGQYLMIKDRNKSIIPQFQKDMDELVANLCAEFGFYIASNEKNIQGFYQKFSIKR